MAGTIPNAGKQGKYRKKSNEMFPTDRKKAVAHVISMAKKDGYTIDGTKAEQILDQQTSASKDFTAIPEPVKAAAEELKNTATQEGFIDGMLLAKYVRSLFKTKKSKALAGKTANDLWSMLTPEQREGIKLLAAK